MSSVLSLEGADLFLAPVALQRLPRSAAGSKDLHRLSSTPCKQTHKLIVSGSLFSLLLVVIYLALGSCDN